MASHQGLTRAAFYIQGGYLFITGVWPIIDIDSFMYVSCPKTDIWLVKAMGAVLLCTGLCLLVSAVIKENGLSLKILALTNAAALAVIDYYYVATGVICKVYLVDAVIEILFIFLWLFAFLTRKRPKPFITWQRHNI